MIHSRLSVKRDLLLEVSLSKLSLDVAPTSVATFQPTGKLQMLQFILSFKFSSAFALHIHFFGSGQATVGQSGMLSSFGRFLP